MYLSRLTLNPRSFAARRDGASDYEMHSTLARTLGHVPAGEAERVLFRIDRDPRGNPTQVLVQSRHLSDFSVLPREYVERLEGPKPYDPQLASGQTLFFRLRANPTVKRQGKRLSLFRECEQRAWLVRKLHAAGVEVLDCRVITLGLRRAYKHRAEESQSAQTHFGVLFEGVLRVTDPVALRVAVENGIGSAKGYGFGLLSLAPA